jgi:hypothetical protein
MVSRVRGLDMFHILLDTQVDGKVTLTSTVFLTRCEWRRSEDTCTCEILLSMYIACILEACEGPLSRPRWWYQRLSCAEIVLVPVRCSRTVVSHWIKDSRVMLSASQYTKSMLIPVKYNHLSKKVQHTLHEGISLHVPCTPASSSAVLHVACRIRRAEPMKRR